MSTVAHARPAHSLVSFHDHPTDLDRSHFCCGGVLVAPGWVLTVKHLFDDVATSRLVARPLADSRRACRILGTPLAHPDLDAALVQIEEPPSTAVPAAWDDRPLDGFSGDLALNGFHEGRIEIRPIDAIHTFDDQYRHWPFEPKQPKGHSGSGLSREGRLVGIAIRHYKDPNTNNGCALSVSQLAEWLRASLPISLVPAGQRTVLPGRTEVLAALRTAWTSLLSHRSLRDTEDFSARRLRADEFTGQLAGLAGFVACEQAMDAVYGLAKTLVARVAAGSFSIDKPQRAELRTLLTTAMGQAAKLGVDLAALSGSLDSADPLSLNAGWPVGAMIALRLDPGRCWALPGGGRQARVIDTHVFEPSLEAGEGEPAADDLSRETYLRVFPNDPPPGKLSPLNLRELRSELGNLRREGRAWCVLLGSDAGQSTGNVPAALHDWARKMGASIVVLQADEARSIFLGDEDMLIGRLRRFLQLFDTHQDWPAT